jgi:hypothetical protein
MATKYVSAKFGNNANGGTSLKDSYQTIQKGITEAGGSGIVYVYDGKYLEQNLSFSNTQNIYCIGNVVFDGSIFSNLSTIGTIPGRFLSKATIKNYVSINSSTSTSPIRAIGFQDCFIYECGLTDYINLERTIIKTNKAFTILELFTPASAGAVIGKNNVSIYGTSGMLSLSANVSFIEANYAINWIIHSKPTTFLNINACKVKFWHFYSVPITIGAVTKTYNGSSGNALSDLRDAAVTAFGGVAADYFPNCAVYDASTTDCFIDPTLDVKEGFYLKPTSPSATANYITGKHIGALPVARGLIFPTGYTYGSNIQADGTLVDPDDNTPANNTIEYTNPFDHSKVILVENWGEGIIQAERNGDVDNLDRDTDIDANLLGDTDVLTNSEVYVCEVESLSISDGVTTKNYAVGENCLVPATGTWTISATSGVMRKLFTTKAATINVMFSRKDATLAVSGETSYAYGDVTETPAYLRFYVNPYDGVTAKYPMCILDANGIPVLGDADTGFAYTGHALGNAVRVQLRYEKRKSIIQVENAKS